MEKFAIPGDIMKCKETEGTSLARNQLAQAQTRCPSRGMHTPRKACISLLLAQLVQEVLALGQQTFLLSLGFLALALGLRALALHTCRLSIVDDVGSSSPSIVLRTLRLWMQVWCAIDVLSKARKLRVLGIVFCHVASSAPARGVCVRLEGWCDEVFWFRVVVGVVLCDVAL
jgi:hypothetical protein